MDKLLLLLLIFLLCAEFSRVFLELRQLRPVERHAETPAEYLAHASRQSVVVQLKSGTSIKGVLCDVYDDVVVVRHAAVAEMGSMSFTDVDGAQVIPKANVDWIQDLHTVAAGEAS